MSAIARCLTGESRIKHKIKKVDRCLGNKQLHSEVHSLYKGLSHFVFQYVKYSKDRYLVIDVCYLKDDRKVQMLSAQLCTKGMTLPLYQDVFKEGELRGRTINSLNQLNQLIPADQKVIIIMDAGFHVEWFQEIEKHGWHWVYRIRQGKELQVAKTQAWMSVTDLISHIDNKTTDHGTILFTKKHEYSCRMVTTRKPLKDVNKRLAEAVRVVKQPAAAITKLQKNRGY